jgi:glycosyltransferase involved in cell wall biosynthesis
VTRYGFLSTYPPTRCGLATFTEALAAAIGEAKSDIASIIRVLDAPEPRLDADDARPRIVADLIAADRVSMMRSVVALDACDIVIVQHEYGIYGGTDGDEVLGVLAAIEVPSIVVLHTVLATPTRRQRSVLIDVCRLASIVVVMTDSARAILAENYAVDMRTVRVIPHGVADIAVEPMLHEAKRVVTWGLISPGKGIEWGIRALAQLADIRPPVEYVVAGQTHPKVLAHSGEAYRRMLTDLVDELGLSGSVRLEGHYLEPDELVALRASADVVLLPYDSRVQVTSGVLAEAVAAGVPVVATGFPHAVELLEGGAGLIARHEDSTSIAQALRSILMGDALADAMRETALRSARSTRWPVVADQYRALAALLGAARAA